MASNREILAAILKTVAYADVFDYPMTAREIHRYLLQVSASPESVNQILKGQETVPRVLSTRGGFFMLPGREPVLQTRIRRAAIAEKLWPLARDYGRSLASIPFVRMVAVTGALAVNNSDSDADIDYFLITQPGRLWVCRALVILLVRRGARRGVVLCPNYFLSASALALRERNLFTARELTQMIPISGFEVYRQMRAANRWTEQFLPNAAGPPAATPAQETVPSRLQAAGEVLFRSPVGTWIDNWERRRKVARFRSHHPMTEETNFGPDRCQGHFGGYRQKTLAAYQERVKRLLTEGS